MITTKNKHGQDIKINTARLAEAVLAEMGSICQAEKLKQQSVTSALILLLSGLNTKGLNEFFESSADYIFMEMGDKLTGSELGAAIGGAVQKSIRQIGLMSPEMGRVGPNVGPAIWNLIHATDSWWQAWRCIFAGFASPDTEEFLK